MDKLDKIEYGIIGGSGFYEMPGFDESHRMKLRTPFGEPSDEYVLGTLSGRSVAFLPRHGVGHRHLPSEINFRANTYGFKLLGAKALVSVSAVGSLRQKFHPGEILIPDQMVDRTRRRPDTFFGEGIVAHVSMADPYCPHLREGLLNACRKLDLAVHDGGTYLCMEGPQFSTRGESLLYQRWGMDVIGMTNLQESKLAREAEMCYATLAMVTDYDCWHPEHDSVKIEDVLRVLAKNTKNAQAVIKTLLETDGAPETCSCRTALENAVITDPKYWPEATRRRLSPLMERLLEKVK